MRGRWECKLGFCKAKAYEGCLPELMLSSTAASQGFGQDLRPVAPPYSYALVSLSNVAATTCQYEALKCALQDRCLYV